VQARSETNPYGTTPGYWMQANTKINNCGTTYTSNDTGMLSFLSPDKIGFKMGQIGQMQCRSALPDFIFENGQMVKVQMVDNSVIEIFSGYLVLS
jgi:hypothetical protein